MACSLQVALGFRVNFTSQHDRIRDTDKVGNALLLGVSVRVLLEEMMV